MNPCKKTIGWADYTWNLITGCKRGCSYCYARGIHEMRQAALLAGKHLPEYYRKPFEEIQFHPERLNDKGLRAKKPRTIFADSMSDCAYWGKEHWENFVRVIKNSPQHTFMLLTKDHTAYEGLPKYKNLMTGLTLTCEQDRNTQYERLRKMEHCSRPFLSLEPLLGTLKCKLQDPELVIVGAMTGKDAVIPRKEWIQSVRDNVPAEKIYWKENIRKYL